MITRQGQRLVNPAGRETTLYTWEDSEKPPRAVIQLSHGMCEHLLRYDTAARRLCEQGCAVWGANHPGHDPALPSADKGYFGPEGYEGAVEQLHQVTALIRERYPDVPIVLLGHSMGSFLARAYLVRYGRELDAAILMGTAGPSTLVSVGRGVVRGLQRLYGGRKVVPATDKALDFVCGRRLRPYEGRYGWLSRDGYVVRAFEEDPNCGFSFPLNGLDALLGVMQEISSPAWFRAVPKTLPILLLAGEEDPVGDYGKGVREVAYRLKRAGATVWVRMFPGARHELFNEWNADEVFRVIERFLDRVLRP